MVATDKGMPASAQEADVDPALWHRGVTDELQLKTLLEEHNRWTGSRRARELLDRWDEARSRFVKVFPSEYKRALCGNSTKNRLVASVKSAKSASKKEAVSAK